MDKECERCNGLGYVIENAHKVRCQCQRREESNGLFDPFGFVNGFLDQIEDALQPKTDDDSDDFNLEDLDDDTL